ncbi:MAG TPA: BatA domain-containing protein [Mucilaginibacter sp.]
MFQFLNPIWLFAAAAVVIPVAIHLWNIRPGKVLKVGSISLMDAASRKSSRSFKLLDIPLFILRCLLLILLALLLAIPVWQKKLQATKVKGWVLVPKESLQDTYSKFKTGIDSLTNAGYEFHYFNQGFEIADLKKIMGHPNDSVSTETIQPNYWSLVDQLNAKVPSTLPVYIFTPNRISGFTGLKPQVALNLHWQTYIPADSSSTWIAGAWFNNNNTIRVAQGISKPSGTTYTYTNIQAGNQPNSPFNVNINNGQPTVSLKTGDKATINVDTAVLQIAIYTDNNTADADYLKAALQAVSQFTQHKTVIKQYGDANAIPANQSWIFWLSEKPISEKLLHQSHNVLRYEKGKVIGSASWLNNSGQYSFALQQQKVALFKLIEAKVTDNNVWRDGFGHPALSVQKQGQTNIYSFYSRFNPTWNDLVWSNDFPAWIMKLLYNDNATLSDKYDKRVLDEQQLMPVNSNETHTITAKTTGSINLSNYFWLVLALLFLAERWLANKTQNITANG